jgi:hypothetical protein
VTTVGLTKKPRSPFVPPPVRRAAGALEEAEHPLLLRLGDHGAHLDVLALGRIADLEGLDLRDELLEQLVVDLRAGDDPRRRRAVLSGVPVAGDPDPLGDGCRVGVVEDDDRRLAAQLEVDALQRLGRGLRHLPAGRHVAGQRDHAHVGVADDARPDRLAVA